MQHYILRIRLIVMRIRVSPHNHLLCLSPPSPNQESEEDLIDEHDTHPFFRAIYLDDNEMVKMLIKDTNVDVNMANDEGRTPLMEAVEFGYTDIVISLLLAGADANLGNNTGLTPLRIAKAKNDTKIMKLLLTTIAYKQTPEDVEAFDKWDELFPDSPTNSSDNESSDNESSDNGRHDAVKKVTNTSTGGGDGKKKALLAGIELFEKGTLKKTDKFKGGGNGEKGGNPNPLLAEIKQFKTQDLKKAQEVTEQQKKPQFTGGPLEKQINDAMNKNPGLNAKLDQRRQAIESDGDDESSSDGGWDSD